MISSRARSNRFGRYVLGQHRARHVERHDHVLSLTPHRLHASSELRTSEGQDEEGDRRKHGYTLGCPPPAAEGRAQFLHQRQISELGERPFPCLARSPEERAHSRDQEQPEENLGRDEAEHGGTDLPVNVLRQLTKDGLAEADLDEQKQQTGSERIMEELPITREVLHFDLRGSRGRRSPRRSG